jgi:hypothetical protein
MVDLRNQFIIWGNLVTGKEHIYLREMQGSSGDGRMQAVWDQEAEFLLEVALSYLTNSTAKTY